MTAEQVLDALIAVCSDKIWATELALIGGSRRIDFWTLEPAASRGFRATAYEIKVSRSDFRRDSEAKQEGALLFSDRFWYAAPSGLIARDQVPGWAGLMEVAPDNRITIAKRAPKLQKAEPTWDFVVSLMRNCAASRRDVSLLNVQIGMLQSQIARAERVERARRERDFHRWVKRASAEREAEQ